jgi:hypothetical protein
LGFSLTLAILTLNRPGASLHASGASPPPRAPPPQNVACPVPSPDMLALALCASLCERDADCRHGKACCSNGCGRVCYSRSALPAAPVKRD